MGAQDERAFIARMPRHIECILHLPRRMIGGHVHGAEVIPVGFNFRSFCPGKPHLAKNGDDFINRLGNGVNLAALAWAGGLGNIDPFLS